MIMKRLGLILFWSVAALASDPEATRLFRRVSPLVFQLKTAVHKNSPKASYGTAFVVDRAGYLVTNYHVVASAIQKADEYRIFLVDGSDSREARVVAVDVLRDLALVKVDRVFPDALKLEPELPSQGARVYSLGQPADLNMAIVEGVYNNLVSAGPFENLHLSSPINGGMSGGPTVDARGRVVGINVAILIRAQNISFAVPASYALELLRRGRGRQIASPSDFHGDIQGQILSLQEGLFSPVGSETERLPGWSILKPSEDLTCWGQNADHEKGVFERYVEVCNLSHAVFLDDITSTGTYEIHYETFRSDKLNPLQFARLLDRQYNDVGDPFSGYIHGLGQPDNPLLTHFDCDSRVVTNGNGVLLRVNYCLRGYKAYPELVDVEFKAVTLVSRGPALVALGALRGFTPESAKRFVKAHLEAIRREP